MSQVTAKTHAVVNAAVVVGVIAVAAIFAAVGIVWTRRAKFARKAQRMHRRSNTTLTSTHRPEMSSIDLVNDFINGYSETNERNPVVMSYFEPHDLAVHLPKQPPRAYVSNTSTATSPEPTCRPDSSDVGSSGNLESNVSQSAGTPHRETELPHPFSPRFPLTTKLGISEHVSRVKSRPSVVPALQLDDVRIDSSNQRFGSARPHEPTQMSTHITAHANREVAPIKDRPSRFASGESLIPPTSVAQLPSPPPTPTFPTPVAQVSSRHASRLSIGFKFPSMPPTPTFSKLAVVSQFSRSALSLIVRDVSQEISEDHQIWSDVLSLEDYGREDLFVRTRASITIRDHLPSPPATPTVLFTPPSPTSTLPASPPAPVEVDKERLHVWRSATKLVQITSDNDEGKDDSANHLGGLAAFTAAHDQAKAAQARRGIKAKISSEVKTSLNARDSSPPAYQSFGFDYESLLAQKRASSSARTPAPVASTRRMFLNQVATIMRPRPPLEEFEPLLCRRVDGSRLYARSVFTGFPGHPSTTLPDAPVPRRRMDPGRRTAICRVSEALEEWKEGRVDEEAVMGLAV